MATAARCLVCRNCGAQVPLRPQHACYECFGPLEVGYDTAELARITRAQIEAGPANIWRYAPLLPAGILDRRKQGFGIPLGNWFRGGLTGLFSDVLEAPRTRQRGYFEPVFVQRLLREHLRGERDHTLRLWQLLVFELWHRQYLDTAAVGAPAAHVG